MKSMKVLSLVAVLVVLGASASYAASSAVTITGSGNVTYTGWPPQIAIPPFPTPLDASWVNISAAPAAGASESSNGSHTMQWVIGWATNPSTTYTANFLVVVEALDTTNTGDAASDSITLKWELVGRGGTVYAPAASQVTISNAVADGADYSNNQQVSLSFTTPPNNLDGQNSGYLRLTASATVNATTAQIVDPDPDPDPIIPAPGAVVLSSLGIGLVGWLRRRHTL